jgi:hypothetical protein
MNKSTSSPMFLTREEIHALTTRVQYSAQIKALRAMGIEHRVRPDGSLAVLRSHIEQLFGGMSKTRNDPVKEPNWGALNAART